MIEMQRNWLSGLFWSCLAVFALSLCAKEVSEDDVLFASGRWLEANAAFWGNAQLPVPSSAKRMVDAEGKPLPLWKVSLSPCGYIVFSSDDTLPPVVAFNAKGGAAKLPETLSLMLEKQGQIFQDALTAEKTRGDSTAENQECWNALLARTRAYSITPGSIIRQPMLDTEWEQNSPFNMLCPNSSTSKERAVTGCVAVAAGQVMKFHEWPVAGTGSKEVVDAEGAIQATISADYSFPYNWDAIPDDTNTLEKASDAIPLARLLMDAGILGSKKDELNNDTLNYELDNTYAASARLQEFLPKYLYYSTAIQYGDTRSGVTGGPIPQSTLYSRIRNDMVNGLPAIVCFPGHAFVADGLGTSGGKDYYHFNY